VWDRVMLVVGVGLGIIALTADAIGIGAAPGFGRWQRVALGVALVLVVLGAARIGRRERR
jgi:hypothetical protein